MCQLDPFINRVKPINLFISCWVCLRFMDRVKHCHSQASPSFERGHGFKPIQQYICVGVHICLSLHIAGPTLSTLKKTWYKALKKVLNICKEPRLQNLSSTLTVNECNQKCNLPYIWNLFNTQNLINNYFIEFLLKGFLTNGPDSGRFLSAPFFGRK